MIAPVLNRRYFLNKDTFMQKLTNYIFNGRGLGFLWLFIFTFISAAVISIKLQKLSDSLIPSLQAAADQILPIKIEHGKIITPDNTFKTVHIKLSENFPEIQIPFVINTTIDTINPAQLPEGLYLTKTAFYTVSPKQTKITAFNDSLDIPQGDYTDIFRKFAFYIISFVFIFLIIAFFIGVTVLSLFYTLTALLLATLMQRQTNFDFRMRLSSSAVIFAYTLSLILSVFGSSVSGTILFLLILILQGMFIYNMPKK